MHRIRMLSACAVLATLAPLAASTPTHAASTKTYTSSSCGYSLSYPANWPVKQEKSDVLFGVPTYNVRVRCYKHTNITAAGWLRAVKQSLVKAGFRVLQAKSSGSVAIIDVAGKTDVDRFVGDKHGDTLYDFQYAASTKAVFNSHVSLFKAMVDSIRFK